MRFRIIFDKDRYTSSAGQKVFGDVIYIEGDGLTKQGAEEIASAMDYQHDGGLDGQFRVQAATQWTDIDEC